MRITNKTEYIMRGVSPALASSNFGHDIKVAINMKVKNQTKEGYIECPIGGGDGLGFP